MEKEKARLSLFVNDMILYIEANEENNGNYLKVQRWYH